jgi:chaperonin GroES
MSLHFNKSVSREVVAAAAETLGALAAVPDSKGGRSPLSGLFLSPAPLAVYPLPLDSLSQGRVQLKEAKPVSWRVFVIDERNEPVAVAEVAPPGSGRPAHCLSYSRGQQVFSSGKVLEEAEAPTSKGYYEPRFLEIPGLDATAVWLKNLEDGDDRIIPVDPVPRYLRMKAEYTPAEFLERVRPAASSRLRFDDSPTTLAIQPLEDRVVIEQIAVEEQTAGGILSPETAQEKPQRGRVLAVGPGKLLDSGERAPISVEEGDEVLFGKYSGTEIKVEGEEIKILRESDILAKIVE